MEASRATFSSTFGTDRRSAWVYGWAGWLNRSRTVAVSTILPAYMTAARFAHPGHNTQIVSYENQSEPGLLLDFPQEVEILHLDGGVE